MASSRKQFKKGDSVLVPTYEISKIGTTFTLNPDKKWPAVIHSIVDDVTYSIRYLTYENQILATFVHPLSFPGNSMYVNLLH